MGEPSICRDVIDDRDVITETRGDWGRFAEATAATLGQAQ